MERGSGRAASTVATHRGAAGKGATVKKAIAAARAEVEALQREVARLGALVEASSSGGDEG